MTQHDADDLYTRLDSLLARERAALLSGDLHAVGALAKEKEALAARLESLGPEALAAARSLGAAARRNQALLDGALQGIRLAAARLSAWRLMIPRAARPPSPASCRTGSNAGHEQFVSNAREIAKGG
jgi:hypothetical protein